MGAGQGDKGRIRFEQRSKLRHESLELTPLISSQYCIHGEAHLSREFLEEETGRNRCLC